MNSCKEVNVNESLKETEKLKINKETEGYRNPNSKSYSKNVIGIWYENNKDKNPDFEITEDFFLDLNSEKREKMKYKIKDNKIEINYPDAKKIGLIKKAENDSLVIYWANGNFNTYLKVKSNYSL
jgi:hypothetical protein